MTSDNREWLVGIPDVPEFNAAVIARTDQYVLLIGIKVQISDHRNVGPFDRERRSETLGVNEMSNQQRQHILRKF